MLFIQKSNMTVTQNELVCITYCGNILKEIDLLKS